MLRDGLINDHTSRELFTEITLTEALLKGSRRGNSHRHPGWSTFEVPAANRQQISRRKRGEGKATVLMARQPDACLRIPCGRFWDKDMLEQ